MPSGSIRNRVPGLTGRAGVVDTRYPVGSDSYYRRNAPPINYVPNPQPRPRISGGPSKTFSIAKLLSHSAGIKSS
jgi:hypothetical protein